MLGAAAFLIAEFLKISYLDVIWMATIPTCLYYLSLLFMVELDAKRFGAKAVPYDKSLTLWQMTKRYGFHFTSLIAVIVFMIVRLFADAVGVLFDAAVLRAELPAPRHRAEGPEAGARARRRLDRRAQRGDHLRVGRHHRRRRHADRPRA